MSKSKILVILINILIINVSFSSENNNLNIISFNIHGFGKILGGRKIEYKISKILNEISNYDLIFIQENWKYKKLILDMLPMHQLIFGEERKNKFSHPSGLLIGINENIKIIDYDEFIYKGCNGIIAHGSDCFASKGFIYLRIMFNGQKLDIYNTHLDSGDSIKDNITRRIQLSSLKDYVIENSVNNSIIICGDFNMDYKNSLHIKDFIDQLELDLLLWDDKYFLEKKVDYIFYRLDTSQVKDDKITEILYHLSDHPPLSMNIKIK